MWSRRGNLVPRHHKSNATGRAVTHLALASSPGGRWYAATAMRDAERRVAADVATR